MNKKVKILNKDGICFGYDLTNGKVYEIIKESKIGSGSTWVVDDVGSELCISKSEFNHIEFITETKDATKRLTREEAVMAMLKGAKIGWGDVNNGYAYYQLDQGFMFYNKGENKIEHVVAFLNHYNGYYVIKPELEFRGKIYDEEKFLEAIKDLDEL